MSTASLITSIAHGLMVYIGIFLLIAGLIGNILNIIIFLSLKTFRQTSSVVYLIVSSLMNIGQLLTGLISRIMFNALMVDLTLESAFYCKFRQYLIHFFAFSSLTCVSLSIIDQFLKTSTRPQWQQWSNIKTACYLSGISLIFWLIYLCPHFIYYDLIITNQRFCTPTNINYLQYVDDFVVPVLWFGLPFFITTLFSLLTYRNIKQIPYRTVPLVRRAIDEQLSVMILVQVIVNIFVTAPYIIFLTVTSHITLSIDSLTLAQTQLIKNIVLCLYYLYPVSPFYIYVCASERFRRQLHHVLIDVYLNRWRKRRIQAIDHELTRTNRTQLEDGSI